MKIKPKNIQKQTKTFAPGPLTNEIKRKGADGQFSSLAALFSLRIVVGCQMN